MALDLLVYVILFVSLFFEVFAILTFFEKGAIRRRHKIDVETYPSVSIIVPCYNEGATIKGTVDSLLAVDYPRDKYSIILVDDGSTDNTAEIMRQYKENPLVTVIHKENGGKHTALNAGIAVSNSEFVGCLDADSFVTPQALKRVMANFDNDSIGAVTSSMSVNDPKTMLEHMQDAEYMFGIMLRHSMATFNGLYVTPGPFTIYRKKIFEALGPFKDAHQTEDMEIAMRMQREGKWQIQNAPSASVFTTVPTTVVGLIKQRTRWGTGFLRNSFDYRDLIGNPKKGVLGLLVLPLAYFSVVSGIIFIGITLFKAGQALWEYTTRAMEVPLSYTFGVPSFDWFFVPVTPLSILSLITLSIMIAFIFMGAKIAEKETRFGFFLIWYFLLYGFIASAWQVRAIFDVLTGTRRSWR